MTDTRSDTRFNSKRSKPLDFQRTTSAKVYHNKADWQTAQTHPEFPLFAHATKRWAKKVRGKLHYFGPWSDPQAALARWLDEKDALLAGRKPRPKAVRDLANAFLTAMRERVDTRELTPRSWSDLYQVCARIIKVFGPGRAVDDLQTDDFELLRKSFASTHGLVTLQSDLTRTRILFNWGTRTGRISDRNYRAMIVRPTAKAIRRDRLTKPRREFSRDELHALIGAAPQPMRAMILLGLLDAVSREIELLDEQLKTLAHHDDRMRLLVTLPGIDYVVAVVLMGALGDISRFRDGDHVASYLGLVPSTRQSEIIVTTDRSRSAVAVTRGGC